MYRRPLIAAVAAVALAVTACSTTPAASGSGGSAAPPPGAPAKVTLQLQWVAQGQFAGYYAAVDQGYYKDAGLDVTIKEGGVDIVPQTVLAQGQADYAIAWVPKALASREQGAEITDVAQVFQRSGTRQVSFKTKNITAARRLQGQEDRQLGLRQRVRAVRGHDAGRAQARQRRHARPAAVRHAGPAQAATSTPRRRCPTTSTRRCWRRRTRRPGSSTSPRDFNVINWNDDGTAMLQDAIWANTEKLSDQAYQDQTVKFIAASLKGWIYCRDNVDSCRDIVVKAGSKLGASHQLWQVNEVNKLIWPSPSAGVGDDRPGRVGRRR